MMRISHISSGIESITGAEIFTLFVDAKSRYVNPQSTLAFWGDTAIPD